MKKIIALALCICLISCLFAGCGKSEPSKDTSSSTATGKIDSLASKGKIDGVDYGLGADIETVKAHYKELAEKYAEEHGDDDHDHGVTGEEGHYYYLDEYDDHTVIDVSSARFYFENGKEDKGISAIASDSDTFGFSVGVTTKYEVEEALKAEGKAVNAGEDELRFLAVRTEPVLVLRYEFGDYQLDFYFYDNLLITTVIIDTENWTL